MLNSSEELSYWYLRLNGFFLLDNFVIHKSETIDYTSDADLLAIRPPFVHEDIGGNEKDWDQTLFSNFSNSATIGIICQVKGGAIGDKELFREPYLSYSIKRLGLTKDITDVLKQLKGNAVATFENELGTKCHIAKLLITRDAAKKQSDFIEIRLKDIYNFIQNRIDNYPKEKYRDRNFFSSIGLQTIIELDNIKRTEE